MSSPDEFRDLENRLRHSKPPVEPLPPFAKLRLRNQLMEQAKMKQRDFSFGRLAMTLGGFLLIVGVPLLFWLSQSGRATGVSGSGIDTSRPTATPLPAATAVSQVEQEPADSVWVVAADPPPGTAVNPEETIRLILGYQLAGASEAELSVKLTSGQPDPAGPNAAAGRLTVVEKVSQGSGTIGVSLDLSQLEDGPDDPAGLGLNLLLRDPAAGSGKLLYLTFLDGWPLQVAGTESGGANALGADARATINSISPARPYTAENVPDGTLVEVEVNVSYSLSGTEEAVLVLGYDFTEVDTTRSHLEQFPITGSNGELPLVLMMDSTFFNADGSLKNGLSFFARINSFDRATGGYVNLYPGGVPLTEAERSIQPQG